MKIEPEPDCLSPQHVKARLQDIIEAIKDNKDIDVPESEIRELQRFFNLRSMVFLQAARSELKMNEARKRMRMTVQIVEVADEVTVYEIMRCFDWRPSTHENRVQK